METKSVENLFKSKTVSMKSASEATIQELLKNFRGLRKEDLEPMNPEYSCIICKNPTCGYVGTPGRSCMYHERTTEEEFALRYKFLSKWDKHK